MSRGAAVDRITSLISKRPASPRRASSPPPRADRGTSGHAAPGSGGRLCVQWGAAAAAVPRRDEAIIPPPEIGALNFFHYSLARLGWRLWCISSKSSASADLQASAYVRIANLPQHVADSLKRLRGLVAKAAPRVRGGLLHRVKFVSRGVVWIDGRRVAAWAFV